MGDVPKLGQLCDPSAGRDAVHIAIAPVVAAETLSPGQHVGLDSAGQATGFAPVTVGIVDPYLTDAVRAGERFWLCLFPNTVTSLRHMWTHPAFAPKVPTMKESAGE